MESKRILFVSQEITPYLPETHMSVIGRQLPQGIQERGREIRTFMPRYGCINERRNQLHEVIRLSGMNLIINDADHPLIIKVASIQSARMQVYFIDNEDYFQRKNVLKDNDGSYFQDNEERAIFFARGVLETVKKLRWSPDLIHCQGWFTAMLPIYVKKAYNDDPLFANTKVVFSVYDDGFTNTFDPSMKDKILFDRIIPTDVSMLTKFDYLDFVKLASAYSDGMVYGSDKVDPAVDAFLKSTGKPLLGFQEPETYIEAYDKFYDTILEN